jgi:hypothetical protein
VNKRTKTRPGRSPVKVRCAYCHDDLRQQRERRFCAGCMTPHHAECWEEHGACCADGCQEVEWIVPDRERKPNRPARKRSPNRRNATSARIESEGNTALILGIVAVMACGLVGPFAIMKANGVSDMARRARQPVPGSATGGLVLGWLGTAGVVLGIAVVLLQIGVFAAI